MISVFLAGQSQIGSALLQVLERCQYNLVVPLSLLFSSTLLKVSLNVSLVSSSVLSSALVPGSSPGARRRRPAEGPRSVPPVPGLARTLLLRQQTPAERHPPGAQSPR